jgi:hypothetical protein
MSTQTHVLCAMLARIVSIENLLAVEGADKETLYRDRYKLVTMAMGIAATMDYVTGVRTEDADWSVYCIMLPEVGEISWHMPAHKVAFTGYDTKEKCARIERFIDAQCPTVAASK